MAIAASLFPLALTGRDFVFVAFTANIVARKVPSVVVLAIFHALMAGQTFHFHFQMGFMGKTDPVLRSLHQ